MFVIKHFIYFGSAYLRKVLYCNTFGTLFLCKDKNASRFSDLY